MSRRMKVLLLFLMGFAALASLVAFRYYTVQVKASRLEHITPPAPYFPADAIWTQDISSAPLDPQSDTIISWLKDAGGWGLNHMQVDFSLRVLQADPTTPLAPFQNGPEWVADDSDVIREIPLPMGGGLEGEKNYHCSSDSNDCHLLVVDRGRNKLIEAFHANANAQGMTANSLAVWDLNRIYPPDGRGDQCTSADAAGFPIAPLLFNADEMATGSINHALRFILPNPRIRANVFVHPATHAGAPKGSSSAPPMGVHFRLKASYDLTRLTPAAQVVARALQRYGMYLADGGNIALTAQSDVDTQAKYSDLGFQSHDLQDLKVTDFEVLRMGPPIPLTYHCVLKK